MACAPSVTTMRPIARKNGLEPAYRASCSCGWSGQADGHVRRGDAEVEAVRHANGGKAPAMKRRPRPVRFR